MPTYLVRHVTTYRYAAPVAFGEHRLMLHPREGRDQRTRSVGIDISPRPTEADWCEDPSGNLVGHVRFLSAARDLRIEAHLEVDVEAADFDPVVLADHSRRVPFVYGAEELPDLARFIERQHRDPGGTLQRWAEAVLHEDPARDSVGLLRRMSARIRAEFTYRRRLEKGTQEPCRTLKLRSGSCRDFAVLMAEAVRSLGFGARFASGYLHVPVDDPAVASIGGHTHAWLQVYLPRVGWLDVDPSSGTLGNRGLIRVALVRDPEQASPVTGSYFGAADDFIDMSVGVTVSERQHHHGRSTRDEMREAAAAA